MTGACELHGAALLERFRDRADAMLTVHPDGERGDVCSVRPGAV